MRYVPRRDVIGGELAVGLLIIKEHVSVVGL
jgi:hypothetical protein